MNIRKVIIDRVKSRPLEKGLEIEYVLEMY